VCSGPACPAQVACEDSVPPSPPSPCGRLSRPPSVESEEVGCCHPASVRSFKRLVQFSRKPLSLPAPSWSHRWTSPPMMVSSVVPQSPHCGGWVFHTGNCPPLRPLLTASGPGSRSGKHGAFPLCPAFWAEQRRCTRQRSAAFCSDGVPEYHTPLRLLAAPRLEFRLRLYPPLPPAGFRVTVAFSVARPFVCGCRTISPLPVRRTLPSLPGSSGSLPHRVARTHHGTLGRNHNAFASRVQARPFPSWGRPVPRGERSP
jgi:hypothetical protein